PVGQLARGEIEIVLGRGRGGQQGSQQESQRAHGGSSPRRMGSSPQVWDTICTRSNRATQAAATRNEVLFGRGERCVRLRFAIPRWRVGLVFAILLRFV